MPNGHNYMSNLLHTPMHRLVISYLTLSMLYWNFEGNWANWQRSTCRFRGCLLDFGVCKIKIYNVRNKMPVNRL